MTAHPAPRPVEPPRSLAQPNMAPMEVPDPVRAPYALRVLPTWPYHRLTTLHLPKCPARPTEETA